MARTQQFFLDVKNKKGILLITLMFLLVIFHNVFNQSFKHWDVSIVLLLMTIYFFYKKEKFIKNIYLTLFCAASFFLITMNYHVLGRLDLIPAELFRSYKQLINQYMWIVPFIALPTIYKFIKFDEKNLQIILQIPLGFLFFYLLYFGIELDFDRGNFSTYFNPVISYDITFISLAILSLSLSFYFKGKLSYLSLLISILTMFLLILHGSRGTWLGIPIALITLSVFYFRDSLQKVLLMLGLFTLFILGNVLIPNSPTMSRVQHLQADTAAISQNNYGNSSGIRLYLWQNSVDLFESNPIVGVGMAQIEIENCKLQQQGNLPTFFQHQHSIYFHELAANGILGILALFLTFISVLIFFIKNIASENKVIKNLAISGFIFVSYYMFCGLTEYYLFFKNTTYIFYLFTASLMSFILIHQQKSKF